VQKKKVWANFQRIIELFTQKIIKKLSKIWVRDPGSGSEIQGSKRHRIPDPEHCYLYKKIIRIHEHAGGTRILLFYECLPNKSATFYPNSSKNRGCNPYRKRVKVKYTRTSLEDKNVNGNPIPCSLHNLNSAFA